MPKRTRWFLLGILGVFMVFALLDTLGAFDSNPWMEIPHGSHSHYVPKQECVPELDINQAPTTRPGPGQTVDCQGRIVPVAD